jgi:hypothetical protein
MKKKMAILGLVLIFLTGCTNINTTSYKDIITSVVTSKHNLTNAHRTGYSYYLPNGVMAKDAKDFNEVLTDANNTYYFYVDVVSYYNRVIEEYQIDTNAYYSEKINYEDKYGYLEINQQKNNKYLVEIMYNYAKIEVIVDSNNLKEAITNSIVILSSIDYNKDVLANIIGDNVLQFNEETYDIFKTKKQDSDFLDVESNNIYDNNDENTKEEDPDLIN